MTTKSHRAAGDAAATAITTEPNTSHSYPITAHKTIGATSYATLPAPSVRAGAPGGGVALHSCHVGKTLGDPSHAASGAGDDRATDGRHRPGAAGQRASLVIHCPECDGAGCWSIAYSLDPYGKTYECEECAGTGEASAADCLEDEAA
jgi:hypothetical protein